MLLSTFLTGCEILLLVSYCNCMEPVSTAVSAAGALILSAMYATWDFTKCRRNECCDDTWVKPNFPGLESDLRQMVHGQHLVDFIVTRSLKGHLQNNNPKKALVMAFHGWTGSGKNHVSKMIANNLYKEGSKSKYVHWYIATQHFPHKSEVEQYKRRLQSEIQKYTKECGRSLFIFDEMDKTPVGVVDALKPYLDYHEQVDGVDYRKNIFIFLSNAGGNDITRTAFNFWLDGKEREDIKMKDIEPIINKGAFNEKGGLQHSEIVEKNLIDVHVPFLPLEKKHVKLCIRDELHLRSELSHDETVQKISDQLEYYPPDFQLYSSSGCKKVSQKVDIYGD